VYSYINSEVYFVDDEGEPISSIFDATPFKSLYLDPDTELNIVYRAEDYQSEPADTIFFDSDLISCTSAGCTLTSDEGYTTICTYRFYYDNFKCIAEDTLGGKLTFYYTQAGDALGDHVIRLYNPMYELSAPILTDLPPLTIEEGSDPVEHIDLDDYVNFGGDLSTLEWTVTEDNFVIESLKQQNAEIGDFVYYQGFQGPIKIWEISYPEDIELKEEYLETEFPNLDLYFAKEGEY